MSPRLFGTDGIRGRAGVGALHPDAVSALGRAVGAVIGAGAAGRPVLLAHDGRASGPELERALARGLVEAGLAPHSAGLLTTPGLAWLTRTGEACAGLMVSASHNPADDNGIKVFDATGSKLADAQEDAIQAALERAATPATAELPDDLHDPALEARFLEHLVERADGLDCGGMRIALDCANGAGSRLGPALLERCGARVEALACAPDGQNINRDCGSTHPGLLQRTVTRDGLELGIALDGDGDRCLMVDERGRLVDGDAILMAMALNLQAEGRLPGSEIVATVMSNRGLHEGLGAHGIAVHTVGVGDRRVVEGMRERGASLGGEQSGHVVFADGDHFSGDGLVCGLRVLSALRASGGTLSALVDGFQAFPQVLVNVPVSAKPPFEQVPGLLNSVTEVERELGQRGRVLLRYSGTEALARVMVEGPDETWIRARADGLADAIRAAIGADPA